jgi:hypothetical protein
MAVPPRISLAWQNINKALALRAMVFDARSLQRFADETCPKEERERQASLRAAGLSTASLDLRQPEQLVAAGNVKAMLQSELREALKDRGLSPVGKPWELRARLDALLAAERKESDLSAAHASAAEAAPSGTGGSDAESAIGATGIGGAAESPSAESVRAKYASKLRTKAGISMLSSGGLASNKQDGPRAEARDQRPASAWHLQSGVRDLFTYLDMRGMVRGLVPSEDRTSDDGAAEQASRMVQSLQVPEFARVLNAAEMAAARRGERDPWTALYHDLGLPPQSVMVVSDSSALLRGARAAGSFACYWRKRLPGAPKQLPSDFSAEVRVHVPRGCSPRHVGPSRPPTVLRACDAPQDCLGIQDVIEQLNGVTYRDPDTEIRSKFGVYAT